MSIGCMNSSARHKGQWSPGNVVREVVPVPLA